MHWVLWTILLAIVYMNIGYLMMWLSYRQAKKRVTLNDGGEVYEFDYSWKTFFLFPWSTASEADHILEFFSRGTIFIKKNEAPPAFKAIFSSERKTSYVYGTPFLWPVKIIWPTFILLLGLIFTMVILMVGLGQLVWKVLSRVGQFLWRELTLPTRRLLKDLDD